MSLEHEQENSGDPWITTALIGNYCLDVAILAGKKNEPPVHTRKNGLRKGSSGRVECSTRQMDGG